ncbi:branched-chain amino acid ABC transporter permease [Formosimonas limnophila]|uniref:Branched-chain amino acid ABC transporter permease n=1 Tax=Formosimonas limnophila TaxID=1384487 RepID=A0A8J3FY12_9BURK|nr:branched-chain amino acid ABC transporter permease [Formosimonas limnophila]
MSFLQKLSPKDSMLGILICAVLLMLMPFAVQFLGNTAWVRIIDYTLLYIMLALGLNLVVGFAGLLDLGYIAFYAVGAYMVALLASPHLSDNFASIKAAFPDGWHVPLWVTIPLGAALAAVAGLILGAPILKLRGDYLALVTLGFGEIIRIFMNNLGKDGFNLTNGPRGIARIDPVSIFGHQLSKPLDLGFVTLSKEFQYYYLFLALVVLSVFVCYRLQNSRLGRAWMALREDDIAAKAMGINVRNIKLLAFALGATFGGVAGGMFASFQGFISPESFTYMESIIILAMVVLGGMGHIPGVILGAVLMSLFPEFLRYVVDPVQKAVFGSVVIDTAILRQLILGSAMVLIMLYRPKGLWPTPTREDKKVVEADPSATA